MNNFHRYKSVRDILIKDSIDTVPTKVSIVIVTYKRVNTLKDALSSALNQVRYSDYNVIICDNNPERNDETELFMKTISDSRVKYYKHEKNIGMGGNWNRATELSNSPYTVLLHDDDILFPHYLYVCMQVLAKHKIDIFYPARCYWKEGDQVIPRENLSKKIRIRKTTLWDIVFPYGFQPTGIIYKTNKMIESGGFDEEAYPSLDWFFVAQNTNKLKIYVSDIRLVIYRIGRNSTYCQNTLVSFFQMNYNLMQRVVSQIFFWKYFKDLITDRIAFFDVEALRKYGDISVLNSIDTNVPFRFSRVKRIKIKLFSCLYPILHKIQISLYWEKISIQIN